MKNKFRTISLILVMTGVWVLPVSFASAFHTDKVVTSPIASMVANTGEIFTISPRFYSLNPCEKRQFTANVKDAKGQAVANAQVTWVSTNPDVAYIDDKGFAVAISPGSTIIKAMIGKAYGEPASLFVRDTGPEGSCYNALEK